MAKTKYSVQLSERAQKDFKAIQRYTLKQYGTNQVFIYSAMIKTGIEHIIKNPTSYGHTRHDIPERYRAYVVGEHSIIYRTDNYIIYIVAILHGRMDFSNQLLSN